MCGILASLQRAIWLLASCHTEYIDTSSITYNSTRTKRLPTMWMHTVGTVFQDSFPMSHLPNVFKMTTCFPKQQSFFPLLIGVCNSKLSFIYRDDTIGSSFFQACIGMERLDKSAAHRMYLFIFLQNVVLVLSLVTMNTCLQTGAWKWQYKRWLWLWSHTATCNLDLLKSKLKSTFTGHQKLPRQNAHYSHHRCVIYDFTVYSRPSTQFVCSENESWH